MKKNFLKKYFVLFSIAIFIVSVIFYFLPVNKTFATSLEVTYPKLITNSNPPTDSDTPLDQYLKYIFDAGIALGFFVVFGSLIYAGTLYFLSPVIPNAAAKAKDRVSGAISGLLILVLCYLIITTINPDLAIFKLGKLDEAPAPPPNTESPGVNFYTSTDCSGTANSNVTSVPDVGDGLRNKINCVKVINNSDVSYISILYDNINFWGECQYIDPNADHTQVDPFAASASIYQFDFSPSGDGVYIYRKSFNEVMGKKEANEGGGYLKITNSQIKTAGQKKLYSQYLKNLRFTGESLNYDNPRDCTVPIDEMDCEEYDKNGKCCIKADNNLGCKGDGRACPRLSEENISSIKIAGNYLVLLIQREPSNNATGPWTYCQAYPSLDDLNKDGPQQIKWDTIRARGQNPNTILIAPVVEK
jgi:hypothetical protein